MFGTGETETLRYFAIAFRTRLGKYSGLPSRLGSGPLSSADPQRNKPATHQRLEEFDQPDVFIGAHAAVARLPLLTRDAARYRASFPNMALIAPEKPA
jgi:hypothetical protein